MTKAVRPSLRHERLCIAPVAGVDEAGRGPLAGPVVAAAVILPGKGTPRGLDDSKKLGAAERARLHGRLLDCAIVGVGIVEADEIDSLNIHWATMKAMTLAVQALGCNPGHVLVETGLIDWTRDDGPDARTDTILAADTLVRIGVTDRAELQLGWTPFGHQRTRDKLKALTPA